MIDRFHNYNKPQNYVCVQMPNSKTLRRIRIEGCPYLNCKRYTVAFAINEDGTPGKTLYGWAGYSYECPIIPHWDKDTKWSVIQTDFITKN